MAATDMTKTQMLSVLESDIIDRTDKPTLCSFALDWALNYLDRTAAARGFVFSDLNMEEITTTTISCTFTVDATDTITTTIDIPTGTKVVVSTTATLPTGLAVDTDYWAIRQGATTIKVATSYKNAWIGTTVSITNGTGSGTHTITAYRERLAKPDECRYIYDIRLIDGAMSRKLTAMPPRRLDLFEPFVAQCNAARPTHYIEWKDWISLYPIPNATYVIKIRYYKWQTAFASVSTTAEIDHIDDIIISAAAMYVWKILGEPEQAAIMEKAVESALFKCGKLEKMKPDLVLKPYTGTIARADSDTVDNPFIHSQR